MMSSTFELRSAIERVRAALLANPLDPAAITGCEAELRELGAQIAAAIERDFASSGESAETHAA